MPLNLEDFLALPRVVSLHLSPDGRRLVATVQTVAADGKSFTGALWEIDPEGRRPARRLTHSAQGETAAGFLPDGSILFTSPRPDAAAGDAKDAAAPALYVLPAAGGEPQRLLAPGGGVGDVVVARGSRTVVASAAVHPGTASLADDEAREKARSDAGVSALLIEHYPMHWWDSPLAGREPHYLVLDLAALDGAPPPRDLTPRPPWNGWLADTAADLTPDGSVLVTGARTRHGANAQVDLLRIDVASGEQRVLQQADADHDNPVISPDGRLVACIRYAWGKPAQPAHQELLLVDLDSGEARPLAPDWDGTFGALTWAPDSTALFVATEERGHGPVYRLELDGRRTRLTADGAYGSVVASPDGTTLYALRSHVDAPPEPVALDSRTPEQQPRPLQGPPGAVPTLDARVEELEARGDDGVAIHAWLVLPPDASAAAPAPLALFVHGGPYSSWLGWHWRWNPHVLAAHGYAVLLPDPRLSTGYGRAHVDAAWGDWSGRPYTDVLACVDAAVARPDIDQTRTAAMGGSYGGYMANWIAGHSDRFRAIVSHAGVWAMDQMHGTTDFGPFMEREFGSPVTEFESWMARSPHRSADRMGTPMLVIHGARDRRVPAEEAVRLWTDLQLRGVPSQLLWLPDENHWVLKPQNARVWYQTVIAFLDHHVRGMPWRRPELL